MMNDWTRNTEESEFGSTFAAGAPAERGDNGRSAGGAAAAAVLDDFAKARELLRRKSVLCNLDTGERIATCG